jgi:hypothetical protein
LFDYRALRRFSLKLRVLTERQPPTLLTGEQEVRRFIF